MRVRGRAGRRELRRVPPLVRASPDIVRDIQATAARAAASEVVGSEGERRAAASAAAASEEAADAGRGPIPCALLDISTGVRHDRADCGPDAVPMWAAAASITGAPIPIEWWLDRTVKICTQLRIISAIQRKCRNAITI
jgi:hypothetical protein